MMQQVERKYGGQCVSAKYINSKTHLRWKCSHGHEWTAKADHVLKGIGAQFVPLVYRNEFAASC